MSNRWVDQSGAGTMTGLSFANRAPISDFVAQEAAVGAGEWLHFSGTITLTAVLTVTGDGKRFKGVNATTGADDNSKAILDAGNTYANCLTAAGRSFNSFANLELIRATADGLNPGNSFHLRNIKGRNNGGSGVLGTGIGTAKHCHGNNNTLHGLRISYGLIKYSQGIGNGDAGIYGEYSSADFCISHGNVRGIYYCSASNSIIDNNTTGFENVNGGGYTPQITNCSITNNTTAVKSYSSGYIHEDGNYYYNNTTKFGGTTANIFSYGGSQDGVIDPYTNQASDDFTPSATAPMKNTEIPVGVLAEATNKTYTNSGLNPKYVSPITVTDINPANGGAGASVTITGTNFTGSGNIVKFGGSGGTSATITAQSTTSITATVPSIAIGIYDIYIENSDGQNIVVPNGYEIVSTAVPVSSGIVSCEIISNNKFIIKGSSGTNTPDYWVIYVSEDPDPFTGGYSFKVPYVADKYITLSTKEDHLSYFAGGVRYYFAMRAENSVGEDVNTKVLSNICSGSEYNQRMNITTPVLSL